MGAKDVASKVEEIKTQKVHKEAAKEGGPKEKERRNGRNVHKMQRCLHLQEKKMYGNRFKAVPKVQKHNSFSMQQTKLQSRWHKTCYHFVSCHQTDNS